jgi:hypothetical protein
MSAAVALVLPVACSGSTPRDGGADTHVPDAVVRVDSSVPVVSDAAEDAPSVTAQDAMDKPSIDAAWALDVADDTIASAPQRLDLPITGAGSWGIFDPGPALDPATARIWMSYSTVDPSAWWTPDTNPAASKISTRIAHSDNAGVDWTDDGIVNEASDVVLPGANGVPVQATWEHEVSRLAYDPYAPANARWILIWMTYVAVGSTSVFEHSWISIREGADPRPSGWNSPSKLFVGIKYAAVDDAIGGPPAVYLDGRLSPDLALCGAPTEPGILARPDALYVSLFCASSPGNGRVILTRRLRSTGQWQYVGTFATDADAQALGFDNYSATELIEQNGKQYLTLSPETGRIYKGCTVFEIADLSAATLVRDTITALPRPVLHIELNLGDWEYKFGGACAYVPSSPIGFLYSERFKTPPSFRLFKTFRRI